MATPRTEQRFNGFSKQTLSFYRDLARNNNREWFEAHRDDYLGHVIAPAQAFVATVGPKLQKLRPGVQFNTDYNGKGSIKRIFTDQRFQKDREPYKTCLDLMFWEGPLASKKDNSAFYLRLGVDGLHAVAGIKGFQQPVLKAYRAAVLDSARGPELAKLVAGLGKHKEIEVLGRSLKQVPRGTPDDLPQRELLLHEGLYAVATASPVPQELFGPELADWCLARWKKMAGLHGWLVEHVLARL